MHSLRWFYYTLLIKNYYHQFFDWQHWPEWHKDGFFKSIKLTDSQQVDNERGSVIQLGDILFVKTTALDFQAKVVVRSLCWARWMLLSLYKLMLISWFPPGIFPNQVLMGWHQGQSVVLPYQWNSCFPLRGERGREADGRSPWGGLRGAVEMAGDPIHAQRKGDVAKFRKVQRWFEKKGWSRFMKPGWSWFAELCARDLICPIRSSCTVRIRTAIIPSKNKGFFTPVYTPSPAEIAYAADLNEKESQQGDLCPVNKQ